MHPMHDDQRGLVFEAQFLRLKGRRGPKKAAVAVAASILTTVYHMLRDGTCYQDLGPNYFARRNPARTARTLADRIRSLGSIVEIRSAASSIQIEFLGRAGEPRRAEIGCLAVPGPGKQHHADAAQRKDGPNHDRSKRSIGVLGAQTQDPCGREVNQ